jgi:glycosyltransferase involved in cell wall biosynthesis/GT2 family glycosyltransferase
MLPRDETAPLKVLFATPKAVLGGAERWLLSILDNTDRVDPTVVVMDSGPLVDTLTQRGIRTLTVPTGASAAAMASAALRLRSILRAEQPDVILANGIKPALALVPSSVQWGVPSCWVRHDARFSNSLGRAVAALVDGVVFVAPPTDRETARFSPVHLPPPVTAEPLDAGRARLRLEDLGLATGTDLLLGMFTRLVPQKGLDTAIAALTEVPRWRLVVAGADDPSEPGELVRLKGLADRLGVGERVTWLGHVPDAAVLAGALDAVAVLTRPGGKGYPDGEGYPMNLIEAIAAGVPLIGDPRRVPPLALPHVASACLPVDSDDPHDLARALRILSDTERRRTIADNSARVGRLHPRGPETADALVGLLADLAYRPGAGRRSGPDISVVTTVKNEAEQIQDLALGLLAQARSTDRLIVVDGGSADDTLPRLRALADADPRLRVIVEPGCGISQGRNVGVGQATTDWVACTDAGCVPDPGWLSALRAAAADGRAGLITGTYRASFGQGRAWEIALAHVAYPNPEELRRRTPLVRVYGALFGRAYDATLPTGRSVAFTSRAWRAAGGFPEDLPTAEDVMFGQNAVRAGTRATLCTDACVTWAQRPTLLSNARMFYGYGHGDGLSGDLKLVGRDLLRAGVYAVGPLLLSQRRARPLVLVGAAAYLSLPVVRSLNGPRPIAATALVAPMAAMRDLAKAAGGLAGLFDHRRTP